MQLSNRQQEVLNAINNGLSQKEVGQRLNLSKGRVSQLLHKLEDAGLIRLEHWTSTKLWMVTEGAKPFLGVVVGGLNSPTFRYHNLEVVIPIVRQPDPFDDKLLNKGFELAARRNYKGHQRRFNHGLVFFARNNVLYYPNEIWAATTDECLNLLIKQAQEVRIYLEGVFEGLRLGYPDEKKAFKLVNQHMALLGGAAEVIPPGKPAVGSRYLIDSSKGVPEIEAHHPRYAKGDMDRLVKFFDDTARDNILLPSEVYDWRQDTMRVLETTGLLLASYGDRLKKLEMQK